MVTEYEVDPTQLFDQALKRASKVTKDLRIPLKLIRFDFFKSNAAIWGLKGPGQYEDIQNKTQKEKAVGFVYPILKATGRLERSMSAPGERGNPDTIKTLTKTALTIGSRVPYGIFHQFGTKFLPVRPFLFIGPEAKKFARGPTAGRPNRWLNILNDYVFKVSNKEIG